MTDCNFHFNADNLWQCPTCGWVYPRQSAKPPRRNCPKHTGNHVPPSRRQAVLRQYDAAGMTDPPRAEIERRLDVCEACEEYADFACIRAGATCKKAENWRNKVLIGNCPRFSAAPPAV